MFTKENVITAYYYNDDYSDIEVLYSIGDKIHSAVIEADPNQSDYKDLAAAGYDTDKLAEGTEKYKREQSASFNNLIQDQVNFLLEEAQGELKIQLQAIESDIVVGKQDLKRLALSVDSDLYDTLLDSNGDKDNLFKFKLWALELEFIKSSGKATKSRIRKAKSVFEGMGIVDEVHVLK